MRSRPGGGGGGTGGRNTARVAVAASGFSRAAGSWSACGAIVGARATGAFLRLLHGLVPPSLPGTRGHSLLEDAMLNRNGAVAFIAVVMWAQAGTAQQSVSMQRSCESLTGLALPHTTITSAVAVPEGPIGGGPVAAAVA